MTILSAAAAQAAGAVAFDCEGCGLRVYAFGLAAPPTHGFCAVCTWLCEEVPDPEEMMRLRRLLGHNDPTPRPPPRAAGRSTRPDATDGGGA